MKILILTPLQIEYDNLIDGFNKLGLTFQDVSDLKFKIPCLYNKKFNIYVAIGGHGKCQFAIHAQYLIDVIQDLNLIICCGSAGALTEKIKIGDLVIATKIIEHDFKQLIFKPKKDFPEFTINQEVLLNFKNKINSNQSFDLKYDILASGDEDITSNERAIELISKTTASAVTWESAGGIRASKFNKIPYFEIRTITDSCADQIKNNFLTNIKSGMNNIALILSTYLSYEQKN